MVEIFSGTDTRYPMKIDGTYRALTRSVSTSEIQDATNNGDGFNIHTGKVSFTSTATDQAICYFKNNESRSFVIADIVIGVDKGGTMDNVCYAKLLRNPTGGTIISDAVAVDSQGEGNRDFNSSKSIGSSIAYKASGIGKTLTGGGFFGGIDISQGNRSFANLNITLRNGDSFGVTVDPETSAGTTKIYVVLIGFYK